MTDKTLKAKIRQLHELQSEIDSLTDRADALKDSIKAEMQTREAEELKAGNVVVRYKPVSSSRLDGKALKAELPDVYSRFTTQTEYKRFTLVTA